MATDSFSHWAARFAPRFERHLPRRTDEPWLARFVDRPRFGWDLQALDAGWSRPLYRFIDAQPLAAAGQPLGADNRFLRPALASVLISALPGAAGLDPLAFDMEMSALELHATSATMLDGLANGRDLAASSGEEEELSPAVLITAAYCARQLAASMLWRPGAIAADRRDGLAQRFSRVLVLQGIGHTLDIWGEEARLMHAGPDALADHLRWYVGPLDFELPCELAAAAAGLDAPATVLLVRAGGDLGVAWHCALALARLDRDVPANASPLRWKTLAAGPLPDALREIGATALARSLGTARGVGPGVAAVFERFHGETLAGVAEPMESL